MQQCSRIVTCEDIDPSVAVLASQVISRVAKTGSVASLCTMSHSGCLAYSTVHNGCCHRLCKVYVAYIARGKLQAST